MDNEQRLRRPIFYISDGTGITAETIGASVLTQFEGVDFDPVRIPFVDDEEKAHAAVARVRNAQLHHGARPIVISTVIDPRLSEVLAQSGALMLDVFAPFIVPLERELERKRSSRVGHAHGMVDFAHYEQRINATNFALTHDDGMDVNYNDAEVILVGVSRSGKTPTCLYLALHYGVRAGNYPLTEEDLEGDEMPPRLRAHRRKLFGLTIDPARLQQVRQQRRPNSRYATIEQCRTEVARAEQLFRNEKLHMLSTTNTSIEEIASKIMAAVGLEKQAY
jgi:regulator of PEP synthase PpsR (kinase-PPPase family)